MLLIKNALIPAVIAFLLSYLLVPPTAALSKLCGAIDHPDGVRKINTSPTPRLGGLGFFAAFSLAALICLPLSDGSVAAILSGGAVLVAGGVADDTHSLRPASKLLIQVGAALVALVFIEAPTEFSFYGLISIPLPGILGFLFALGRIVFTINAVNFSDGLDGLASGLSICALLALSIFGFSNGKNVAAIAALLLAAAVVGFLPYNKYRARIFMGDSGSQFLGFSIALLSLGASESGSFTAETSLFLAVPMIDTWFSVVRRLMHGKSPFSADKGHLHHLLLSKGLSHPTSVKLLICLSAIIASVTLFISVRI